jgi:FMN phosphatase YigB (HAD superfamily)
MAMEKVRRRIRREGIVDGDMHGRIAQAMALEVGRSHAETVEIIERLVEREWPTLLERIGPYKGIRKLLDALVAAKIPIVMVSDYPAVAKGAALGLADLPWVAHIDATALGALKPRKEVYLATLAALEVPADRVLHVGDSAELDVAGAAAVGMATALVKKAGSPPKGVVWPEATHPFSSVAKFCKAAMAALGGD